MERAKVGIVVGLRAEAKLLRQTACMVEIGGGDPAGATRAAQRLVGRHTAALLSFGLAGGLNAHLRPGAVIIPKCVVDAGELFRCDASLINMLGGATSEAILASACIAESAAEKRRLFESSMADAVDLESGAVARIAKLNNLPFAVLRAVADPAERDLPPAAMLALSSVGNIQISAVLASVWKQPGQIPALLAIARDAAQARSALIKKLKALDWISEPPPARR